MSDEGLVDRLLAASHDERLSTGTLYLEAANRIERLRRRGATLEQALREEMSDEINVRLAAAEKWIQRTGGHSATAITGDPDDFRVTLEQAKAAIVEEIRLGREAHNRLAAAAERDAASIRSVVNEQAEDEGLWFVAETAAEAYLQQALRRLHAAVEAQR